MTLEHKIWGLCSAADTRYSVVSTFSRAPALRRTCCDATDAHHSFPLGSRPGGLRSSSIRGRASSRAVHGIDPTCSRLPPRCTLRVARRFTHGLKSPYDGLEFVPRHSEIRNPDGSTVFEADGVTVPDGWSQVATDILAQKYFRKAGVPAQRPAVARTGVPAWLQRRSRTWPTAGRPALRRRDGRPAGVPTASPAAGRTGAGRAGYFDTEADAQAFYDEICYMLADADGGAELPAVVQHRPALGLRHRRPGAGALLRRPADRRGRSVAPRAYERPQPHACFIQSVSDDLVNDGGIMDLWVREARIFKYGSGTGTNFSSSARRGRAALRRRQVVGPDELPQDRRPRRRRHQVAAARPAAPPRWSSSTSTTRTSRTFVNWKVVEEQKVAALVTGSRLTQPAPERGPRGDATRRPRRPRARPAREPGAPQGDARGPRGAGARNYIAARDPARPARASREIESRSTTPTGQSKAYYTVSGQNCNNSRAHHQRLHGRGPRRRPVAPVLAPHRAARSREDAMPRPSELWDADRLRGLGLRRPRRAVRHHDQRVAHLPGRRADQREQPVLRVHVPRRHGLQPRVAQPAQFYDADDAAASTSTRTSTPSACGR